MWYPNPYAIALLAISVATLLFVIPISWRRRRIPGGYAFLILTSATFGWTFLYGLELGVPQLATKLLLTNIEYLCIVTAPVAWFAFAVQYTHHGKWLNAMRLIGLAAIPAMTLILLWTNDHHFLMQFAIRLDTTGPFPAIAKTYGTWFWVNYGYSVLLMISGSILLLKRLIGSTESHRGQAISLLIAVASPWIANVLHLARIYPIHRLDLTPMAFAVSIFALAVALFRYRLLDLIPLAQEIAMWEIGEGLVITDPQFRIINLNPAAESMLGADRAPSIGENLASAIPALMSTQALSSPIEWTADFGGRERSFEMQAWPLTDRWCQQIGNAVTLHDISRRRQIERALEFTNARITRLHEIALQLATTKSQENILRLITKTCEAEAPFVSCAVFLANEDTLDCAIRSRRMLGTTFGPIPLDSDQLPVRVFRTGESVRLDSSDDLASEASIAGSWGSAICAPIHEIGVLLLLAPQENAFTEADEYWANLFLQHVEEATKRIRLQAALREQARRDPLTGVYNRRHLPDAIHAEMARAKRAGHRLALAMLDINGFKAVNDLLGHQVGDRVLKETGELLVRHVRDYDLVIRYGGDEFLLILPESDGEIDVVVERLREAFSNWSAQTKLLDPPLSIAVGIAWWSPKDDEDWEETVRRADRAMYDDKTSRIHAESLF